MPIHACEECSSVNTFNGVLTILSSSSPRAFILENVKDVEGTTDGEEEPLVSEISVELAQSFSS
jgi:hypothetical protein